MPQSLVNFAMGIKVWSINKPAIVVMQEYQNASFQPQEYPNFTPTT